MSIDTWLEDPRQLPDMPVLPCRSRKRRARIIYRVQDQSPGTAEEPAPGADAGAG